MKYKPTNKDFKIYGVVYAEKIKGSKNLGLYFYIRKSEKQVKFSSGVIIQGIHWDGNQIIDTPKKDVYKKELLTKLKEIVDYFNSKAIKFPLLSLKDLKKMYNKKSNYENKMGIFKYWKDYIESKSFVPNEIIDNNKYTKFNDDNNSMLMINKSNFSKLNSVIKRLKDFIQNNYSDFEVNEDDINNEFIKKYINVYRIQGYAISTLNKDISIIKNYMGWLIDKKIISNWNSKSIRFEKENISTPITINKHEITKIENMDLKDKNDKYKISVKLMIFGFYTGLRVGDILRQDFSKFDDEKKTYTVYSQKNNKTVKLINNYKINEVISYFKSNGNPQIHVNTYNKYIKEILKDCEIDDEIGINKKGYKILPKYKIASSHMLRKSFITQAISNNINLNVLGRLTGKNYKDVFNPYFKLTDDELINEYNRVFQFSKIIDAKLNENKFDSKDFSNVYKII